MSWQKRIAGMVEFVTDIVMAGDGTTTSNASSEDDKLTSQASWHFGFYSRPKDGARGIVLKADGRGNTSFLIGYRDTQYEVTLEKGEVAIKNAFDAQILLDKDGAIAANSKTGQKVTLNGSDSAAVMDTLIADLKNWVSTVNAVLATNCVNGSTLVGMTVPANTAALSAFATSIGVAGAYKSTKVSHG